ncbi:hypothetical protein MP228_000091 [Amoeboaphelidium protococcarum]|nr:hypothetical protein MP228_000091 [Amoeboaphelidium protococcarum]
MKNSAVVGFLASALLVLVQGAQSLNPSVCPPQTNSKPVDIVWVINEYSSATNPSSDINNYRAFASQVTRAFLSYPSATQQNTVVALRMNAGSVILNKTNDWVAASNSIAAMTSTSSGSDAMSNLGSALTIADSRFDYTTGSNRTRIIIVLASKGPYSQPLINDPTQAAMNIKAQGTQIYFVTASTTLRKQYMANIASRPPSRYVFTVPNWSDYQSFVADFANLINNGDGFVCRAFGDPRVISFDGLSYGFSGTGVYWLVNSPKNAFEIQALVTPCYAGASTTCMTGVAVSYWNPSFTRYLFMLEPAYDTMQVYYQTSTFSLVKIDPSDYQSYSSVWTVQQILPENVFQFSHNVNGTYVAIKQSQLGINVRVQASPLLFNATSGLCGNYNSCADDDLSSANGTAFVTNVDEANIAANWQRVPEDLIAFDLTNAAVTKSDWVSSENAKTPYKAESQDCSRLPGFLQDACKQDSGRTNAAGIALDYQEIVNQECFSFCKLGRFHSAGFVPSDCAEVCQNGNIVSSIALNNLPSKLMNVATPPNSVLVDKQNNRTKVFLPEAVAGDYCLNLTATDRLNRVSYDTVYLRVECTGSSSSPLSVTADNFTVNVNPFFGMPLVQVSSSVSDSSRVRKMSWKVISAPGDDSFPELVNANGYRPRFVPYSVGKHVLQLFVYDGCQYYEKIVGIDVACVAWSPSVGVQGMIIKTANNYAVLSGGSGGSGYPQFTYQSSIQSGVASNYNWTFDFSMIAPGLKPDYTAYPNTIVLHYPQNVTFFNVSTTTSLLTSSMSTPTSTSVGPGATNAYNSYSIPRVYFKTVKDVNTTTQPLQLTTFFQVQPRIDVCNIQIANPTSQSFTVEFQDVVPGGCLGQYNLMVNTSNTCYWQTDSVPLTVSCGPPPVAMIDHCNSVAGTCNVDQTLGNSLPGSSQKFVYYNYTSATYPQMSFRSSESYDYLQLGGGRTLTRKWNVTTSFDPSNQASTYLDSTSASTVTFSPNAAGDYNITLAVSAGSCQSSIGYDSAIVRVLCENPCSGTLSMSTAASIASGTSAQFTASVSNTTCQYFSKYRYNMTGFPDVYNNYFYRNTLGANPNGLVGTLQTASGFTVNPYSTAPTWAGQYTMSLIFNDGCAQSTSTQTFTVTCPNTLSSVTATGAFTASDVNGVMQSINLTAAANVGAAVGTQFYWTVYDQSNAVVSSSVGTNYVTQLAKGSYKLDLTASDQCQAINSTYTLTVNCGSIPTPVLTSTLIPGNSVNVSYTPFDATTVGYTKVWTVRNRYGANMATVTGPGYMYFTPNFLGTYYISLAFVSSSCDTNSTTSIQYNAVAPYTIVPGTQFTSNIQAVMSGRSQGFPQVNINANLTTFTNTTYANVYSNSYWYVVQAPVYSAFSNYTESRSIGSVNGSSTVNTTISVNSTFSYIKSVQSNTTTTTYTQETKYSQLLVYCSQAELRNAGMFSVCFRPDVAGTYKLQLAVVGQYGEVYSLSNPVTVIASCASALNYNGPANNNLMLSSVARELTQVTRVNVDTGLMGLGSVNNLLGYGFVLYGTLNTYPFIYNATTNTSSYVEVPVPQTISASNGRLINNLANRVSFLVTQNYSNYLLELTSTTGCQIVRFNTSLDISYSDSGVGKWNSISSFGGADFAGNTSVNASTAMVYRYNPDKRYGLGFVATYRGNLKSASVAFGRCGAAGFVSGSTSALSTGAIIGIAIGAAVGGLLLLAGGFFLFKKYGHKMFSSGGGSATKNATYTVPTQKSTQVEQTRQDPSVAGEQY